MAVTAPTANGASRGITPPFCVFLFFVSELYCSFTNCLNLYTGSVFSGSSDVPKPLNVVLAPNFSAVSFA